MIHKHYIVICGAFCLLEILFLILEKMHVLDVNEIFWMPFYTYDRIMEEWGKNWPDAFALYVKLIKQSRIQQTNQTYSLNSFLKDWLKRTDERLKKSRDVLKWLWLINDVVIRDELGKIKWHYVRVNYLINENKIRTLGIDYNLSTTPEIQGVDNTMSGKSETNALSNININAWSNKKENLSSEWESETQTTQSSAWEKDTHSSSSKKEWTPPTPPQLLEAYENEKSLVQMIWNSKAVLERAEYKQSKKSRAYKTVSWFIQQLYGKVDTVRFWELRWDTGTRFEYAVNKTKENEWKDIYRTEKEEREYQFYKKSLYLKKQENE